MKVEVCANGIESARVAQNVGAHRIELCQDLSVGGLSPSKATIEHVLRELTIPVHVLVRPRPGDFCYTPNELAGMCGLVEFCQTKGCAGVVLGVLGPNMQIDSKAMTRLIHAAGSMEVTFHRAFDLCSDPYQACSNLIELGLDRLLSSGQAVSADEGLPLLIKLLEKYGGTLEIMPGSGIDQNNAQRFKEAGFPSIHLSGVPKRAITPTDMMSSSAIGTTDPDVIRQVLAICRD